MPPLISEKYPAFAHSQGKLLEFWTNKLARLLLATPPLTNPGGVKRSSLFYRWRNLRIILGVPLKSLLVAIQTPVLPHIRLLRPYF
jgi:hypothetical protein